ncbi:GNAT family N-acetyltransferase [Moritella marina ATCC 15381]|uniref:GNAT family N-acetyltransferase n=1 Tax=Moritella marina ATCC 15381 TaxID=1202962 RepID=A0A5J6WJ19_MORMI|nr:GNAT family N-acetyltransferase [Moritella marina]QFI37987.1 GNAT family N-acetyltransferase [Moritella marina ATCC 15381]
MNIAYRLATEQDYDFAFKLKKAAEYEPIKAIFGWDEAVQQQMHAQEWADGKPMLICIDGFAVGSYKIEMESNHIHFCRFFLLPEYQGKGIGSQVLKQLISFAKEKQLPCKLSHLQGNRVGELYARFGFVIDSCDEQFVYMSRAM